MKHRLPIITVIFFLIVLVFEANKVGEPKLSYVSAYLALYLTYLAFELGQYFGATNKQLEEIKRYVDNPLRGIEAIACIDHIDFPLFYVRFRHVLQYEAREFVYISYMHEEPPLCLDDSPQELYYQTLVDIVQEKSHVTFKRLVIASASNYMWIKRMCNEFEGCRNFSLRILELPDSSTCRPLAVQCVDRNYTFLVALATQEEIPRNRDVMIKDSNLTEKFQWYYLHMYDQAVSLLEAGRQLDEGMQMLENYSPQSG